MTPPAAGPEPGDDEPPDGDSGAPRAADAPDAADVADPADAALYELIAPDVAAWQRAIRTAEPTLPDAEVLDRALRYALVHFRDAAAQQTLAYLRRRAEQAMADAAATVAASAKARQARAALRLAARPPDLADARPRTFRDAAGDTWSVHEVPAGAAPWARGPRCLLFGSQAAIRRVWQYPADWRTLTDAELEALSWHV